MNFEMPQASKELSQEDIIARCKADAAEDFNKWALEDLESFVNKTMDPEKEMDMAPTITEGFSVEDCKILAEEVLRKRKETTE